MTEAEKEIERIKIKLGQPIKVPGGHIVDGIYFEDESDE